MAITGRHQRIEAPSPGPKALSTGPSLQACPIRTFPPRAIIVEVVKVRWLRLDGRSMQTLITAIASARDREKGGEIHEHGMI